MAEEKEHGTTEGKAVDQQQACSPTPSVLKKDYNDFTAWVARTRADLDGDDKRWLAAWEMYDLACSPMDDRERSFIRLGHHLGWCAKAANASDQIREPGRKPPPKQLILYPKMNADTTQSPARCVQAACSALLELAIRWLAEAEIHDANGSADCGTGSDVPYAMGSKCREHAAELEIAVYAMASPNVLALAQQGLGRSVDEGKEGASHE